MYFLFWLNDIRIGYASSKRQKNLCTGLHWNCRMMKYNWCGVMSVFLEIRCNCSVGKKQCHWTLLRAAWILFQITVFGKIHSLTAKMRKHNTIHWSFVPSMLCQWWSVGRRTWPRGQGKDPLAVQKSPVQRFGMTSAWERHYNRGAGAAESWTTGHLLPAASCPPPTPIPVPSPRHSGSHTTFIMQLILGALLQEHWVSGSYSPGQFHLSPDE